MGIELTSTTLKEVLQYDAKTGLFTWKVSRGIVRAGTIAGTPHTHGYTHITLKGKRYFAHRLAWLYTHGSWPSFEIDHVNRLKSDNRLLNLREVTSSQNQQNRLLTKNNSSGFKGVTWNKQKSKWWAKITVNHKKYHLGFFDTPEEASLAYQAGAIKLHTHRPTEIA